MIKYKNNRNIALLSLLLLMLLASCAPTIKLKEQEIIPPKQFNSDLTDTTSTAAKPWTSVFQILT